MVLGWFRRRLETEHRKLAIQNFKAAHDPEMKTLAGMYGDWEAFDGYDSARAFSNYFLKQVNSELKPSVDEIDVAFKLNKGLRTLYDGIGRKDRGSFDRIYAPLGGWKSYFERYDDDSHLWHQQERLDDVLAKRQAEYDKTGIWPDPWDPRFEV